MLADDYERIAKQLAERRAEFLRQLQEDPVVIEKAPGLRLGLSRVRIRLDGFPVGFSLPSASGEHR